MLTKAFHNQVCQIALLHQQTISEGFLSKLGFSFLTSLYRFLIRNELVLVYQKERKVVGFVSCALSSKGMMKRFMLASPDGILKLLMAILKKPSLIKPLLETFNAPSLSVAESSSEIDIPTTELLSISVSPLVQKEGVGTMLLKGLEDALIERKIDSFKVIAGSKLIGANKFYLKNGFVLRKTITIHGDEISNVYVKIL